MKISKVKENNKKAGRYFFSPKTMQFFKCKIETPETTKSGLFITSEKNMHDDPRLFTIRKAVEEGKRIEKIGKFQEFETLKEAREKMLELEK